jgi:hypothetical protein
MKRRPAEDMVLHEQGRTLLLIVAGREMTIVVGVVIVID